MLDGTEHVREICEVTGKRMYSRRDASIVIRQAKRYGGHSKNIPLRSYYCEYCHNWHTTSQKSKGGKYD